jgi:hypothetical protein
MKSLPRIEIIDSAYDQITISAISAIESSARDISRSFVSKVSLLLKVKISTANPDRQNFPRVAVV